MVSSGSTAAFPEPSSTHLPCSFSSFLSLTCSTNSSDRTTYAHRKSTRTIGACSANKATLRLRSWRFVFAVPPQPPQSPSKHRNKSTDTIYKSARICLAVGAFEFFADGDGQTLLTLNGSRDVLEWRRNAGAEVTRWVEEIEGGKKGTVSGEGGKGKVKAVVYDSEVRSVCFPLPSSSDVLSYSSRSRQSPAHHLSSLS